MQSSHRPNSTAWRNMVTFDEADLDRKNYYVFVHHRADILDGLFYAVHRHEDGNTDFCAIFESSELRGREITDKAELRAFYSDLMSSNAWVAGDLGFDIDDFTVIATGSDVSASKSKARAYLEALTYGHDIPSDDVIVVQTLHHPHLRTPYTTKLPFEQYFAN